VNSQTDEAYVLSTQVLGEADLIVTLLGSNFGRVRGVARFARKSRKRFGGCLEPLTRVRVAWTEKTGRELHRIDSMDAVRSFAAMQSDPVNQAACAVLAEVSEAYARDGEPDPKSFDLLGAVLVALEEGTNVWTVLRYFEFWLLRLHGLMPDLRACASCGQAPAPGQAMWVERGMGVRCSRCREGSGEGAMKLHGAELEFLRRARATAPADLDADPAVARPGGALELLLRGTLEAFAERRFRCYRHVRGMTRDLPPEGGRR